MIVSLNTNTVVSEDDGVRHLTEGWKTDEIGIDQTYMVYAIGIYQKSLEFLIDPMENLRPVWYSADCFVVVDGAIPSIWQMSYIPDSKFWTLVIGDELLCSSDKYFDGILERNPKAISDFSVQKNLIVTELS